MIKKNLLFFLFITSLLVIIFLTYKDYGIAWDEKVYIQVGRHYLIQIFNLFRIPHNLTESTFIHGGVHIRTHGVFFDLITLLSTLPFKKFTFELYHLIKALYSVLIFVFLYLIISKLTSKVYGLISVVFLLLIPSFFTFIFVNSIDIPTTLFFTLALWYLFYFLDSNQNIAKQIIFGLIMALIINQRAVFWYLMILNLLFLLILNLRKNKKSLKQLAIEQLTIFISTIFFMHFTHPYLFTHPIVGILDMIRESLKGFPFGAAVLFEGTFYQAGVNPLPWYYLPKMILITTPIIFHILFLIGNLVIFSSTFKNVLIPSMQRSSKDGNSRWIQLYLMMIFYVPIILVILFRPTLYDSWRQFLFLIIPMIIIAMFGLKSLFSFKIGNWSLEIGHWKLITGLLVIISLLFTVKEMITLHPYQYLYFNSLAGGLKGASGKYETDYLGLGYKEGVEWFNENVNDQKKAYKIFVEGDPLSSTTYFKPNMHLTTNVNEADYIFTFTRWSFHLRHPGKTIYTVKREGVPLIFIKKITP
ncbi:glycosyltransferase family 39 protein [Candidatus Roizmanbacteria bacterium]|nr:glycosyltransferase family 39 protein [Candidatus Roizmanbacteria bacterium]